MDLFEQKLREHDLELRKGQIEVLQVNLGKLCNLTCSHCHVEAGPTMTMENMNEQTARAIMKYLEGANIRTLDLTGGAPEMNPWFRPLVQFARERDIHVIDRCNLTILLEDEYEDLPEFLAEQQVEIVASLPCYSQDNVDGQRGNGTFAKSIEALKLLNRFGYGRERILNLVYNPVGAHLPSPQQRLERDYKERLKEDFGIIFNRLYTITNMPITRYEKYLKATGQYDAYTSLLGASFNPETVSGLMCRNTVSVGWDGTLYDCDFNQMLGMSLKNGQLMTVFNTNVEDVEEKNVLIADHCFGCTAGAGSSCQGAVK